MMKPVLLMTALILASILRSPDVKAQQGMRLMSPLHETLSELDKIQLTGDPDSDFAALIITHHRGGIEMLDEVITNGSDQEIIELASRIKENQEKDLIALENLIPDQGGLESNPEFVEEMKSNLEKGKDEMSRNMDLTGSCKYDRSGKTTSTH